MIAGPCGLPRPFKARYLLRLARPIRVQVIYEVGWDPALPVPHLTQRLRLLLDTKGTYGNICHLNQPLFQMAAFALDGEVSPQSCPCRFTFIAKAVTCVTTLDRFLRSEMLSENLRFEKDFLKNTFSCVLGEKSF